MAEPDTILVEVRCNVCGADNVGAFSPLRSGDAGRACPFCGAGVVQAVEVEHIRSTPIIHYAHDVTNSEESK